VRVIVEIPVMTFPIKKKINTELFIARMLVMGPGQKFLTRVGSGQIFVAQVGSGQVGSAIYGLG